MKREKEEGAGIEYQNVCRQVRKDMHIKRYNFQYSEDSEIINMFNFLFYLKKIYI